MAASSLLQRQVSQLTTCSICMERFSGPRVLPCQHTFCLGCLQGHCEDKQPGSVAKCPLCREKFTIPENGPRGLKANFVLQELIEAKLASCRPDPYCEVCSTKQKFLHATVHCVDCGQKLCARCILAHKIGGGRHNVTPLAAEPSSKLTQDQAVIEKQARQLDIRGTQP